MSGNLLATLVASTMLVGSSLAGHVARADDGPPGIVPLDESGQSDTPSPDANVPPALAAQADHDDSMGSLQEGSGVVVAVAGGLATAFALVALGEGVAHHDSMDEKIGGLLAIPAVLLDGGAALLIWAGVDNHDDADAIRAPFIVTPTVGPQGQVGAAASFSLTF
jgi:hypothetical protein